MEVVGASVPIDRAVPLRTQPLPICGDGGGGGGAGAAGTCALSASAARRPRVAVADVAAFRPDLLRFSVAQIFFPHSTSIMSRYTLDWSFGYVWFSLP